MNPGHRTRRRLGRDLRIQQGRIFLTRRERKKLRHVVRKHNAPYRVVLRAQIILWLDMHPAVSAAARRYHVDPTVVRFWQKRFLHEGVDGLKDRTRPGRPPCISPLARCHVIAVACAAPKDYKVQRNVWTLDSLWCTYCMVYPDLDPMSRSTVRRILKDADLRPHRMHMWLHSPDPNFREKVTHICGLYHEPPADSVVLCIDEKTGMQALGRRFPTRWPRPGCPGRFEFEYRRHGTRKLLAAFNPHTGEVYGQMREHRKAVDIIEFMEEIARLHPHKQVHVIWDNLDIHLDGPSLRWQEFNKRHGGRFHFHYTPLHASWVNQVELFFSILSRRVLRYGSFASLEELDSAVLGFIDHWNRDERHPFNWKFKGYPLQIGRKAA